MITSKPRIFRKGIWYILAGYKLKDNQKALDHCEKLNKLERKPLRHQHDNP